MSPEGQFVIVGKNVKTRVMLLSTQYGFELAKLERDVNKYACSKGGRLSDVFISHR